MELRHYGILSLVCALGGVIVCAYHYSLFVITLPARVAERTHECAPENHRIEAHVTYPHRGEYAQETRSLMWSATSAETNIATLAQNWLNILYEERVISRRTRVQTATYEYDGETVLLSFDQPPFDPEAATYKKLMCIESLLNTLQEHIDSINAVRILVHHEPCQDYHLDFSRPWPIEGFCVPPEQPEVTPTENPSNRPFTIMLDAAGDAQNTGRVIGNTFERGISLQCATHLKQKLEQRLPNARIIISRFPGETLEPLQNAAFANRIGTDMFVSLHFYPEHASHSRWYTYVYAWNTSTDFWGKSWNPCSFIPYNQAHEHVAPRSWHYARSAYRVLSHHNVCSACEIVAPQPVPFRPLVGVTCPALGYEIGLVDTETWKAYLDALADSITKACSSDTQEAAH